MAGKGGVEVSYMSHLAAPIDLLLFFLSFFEVSENSPEELCAWLAFKGKKAEKFLCFLQKLATNHAFVLFKIKTENQSVGFLQNFAIASNESRRFIYFYSKLSF